MSPEDLESSLPEFRDIVSIEGDEVILKSGERVPTILFDLKKSMRSGYRVLGILRFIPEESEIAEVESRKSDSPEKTAES